MYIGRMANLTFVRRQHGVLSMTISTLTQLRGEAAKQGLRIGSLLNVDAQVTKHDIRHQTGTGIVSATCFEGWMSCSTILQASPPRGDAYFREQANRRQMKQSLSAIGISSQR